MCLECGEIMLFTLRKAEEAEIQGADEKTRELMLDARANFKPPPAKSKRRAKKKKMKKPGARHRRVLGD
jgi:hypothetical protein